MARLLWVMASEPDRWWSLADLARETGASKATAHGVLLALVDEGFVRRRDVPVSYALGPSLVQLGERAQASVDLAGAAGPVLAALSDATGCTAMVGAVRGHEIAVVAAVSVPHPFGMMLEVGRRSPFAAPIGTVYAGGRVTASWSNGSIGPILHCRFVPVVRWSGRSSSCGAGGGA